MSTLPGHPIQDRTLEDQAPGDIQMTDTSLPSPYLSQIPRAILYWNPTSVWSTVPRLALCEKGYADSAFNLVEVDISKGDNFSPEYLKINPHGTIPTLVVPVLETQERQTRFKSFQDTISILTFMDSSRTTFITPEGERPAPILSPGTIEGKHLCDTLTLAVHLPSADPNFLLLCARSPHELVLKEKGFAGEWVRLRQEALIRYRDEAKPVTPPRRFLEKKLEANTVVYDVYYSPHIGEETDERRGAFFAASRKAWEMGVVEVLNTLEQEMIGPFALGEQISLADLHIIAWLSRVVFLSQGTANPSGLRSLEDQIAGSGVGIGTSGGAKGASGGTGQDWAGGEQTAGTEGASTAAARPTFQVGKKMRHFWELWIERDSFKRVYVKGA